MTRKKQPTYTPLEIGIAKAVMMEEVRVREVINAMFSYIEKQFHSSESGRMRIFGGSKMNKGYMVNVRGWGKFYAITVSGGVAQGRRYGMFNTLRFLADKRFRKSLSGRAPIKDVKISIEK